MSSVMIMAMSPTKQSHARNTGHQLARVNDWAASQFQRCRLSRRGPSRRSAQDTHRPHPNCGMAPVPPPDRRGCRERVGNSPLDGRKGRRTLRRFQSGRTDENSPRTVSCNWPDARFATPCPSEGNCSTGCCGGIPSHRVG
jgi:hypothetical protein